MKRGSRSTKHGVRATYVGGCRCAPCSHAQSRYCQEWSLARAKGARGTVPSRRATDHLAGLLEAGWNIAQVAEVAGVPHTTLRHMSTTILASTEAAVLSVAVDSEISGSHFRPSLGSRRRVRALLALGYPMSWLARELGVDVDSLRLIVRGVHPHLRSRSDESIRAAYERLSMQPVPTWTRQQDKAASTQAVKRARRNGWVTPWAWDDVDDPDETPMGTRVRDAGGVDLDDFMHLVRQGTPPERIASQMGVTVTGIEMNARRNDRPDVLNALIGARPPKKEAA